MRRHVWHTGRHAESRTYVTFVPEAVYIITPAKSCRFLMHKARPQTIKVAIFCTEPKYKVTNGQAARYSNLPSLSPIRMAPNAKPVASHAIVSRNAGDQTPPRPERQRAPSSPRMALYPAMYLSMVCVKPKHFQHPERIRGWCSKLPFTHKFDSLQRTLGLDTPNRVDTRAWQRHVRYL